VDAVFPYYPASPDLDSKHCAGNIGIISVALNFGKNFHPPALYAVLKCMIDAAEASPSSSAEELHQVQLNVVNACMRLKMIRIKASF